MDAIISILKPTGMTSSDAVAKIRGILNEKKVGHLGTLDPLASGVLLIATGRCTRLFDIFLEKRKSYRAFFSFDKTTDTLDSSGIITNTSSRFVSFEEVNAVVNSLIGKHHQYPPLYSAKVIDGKRAYKRARNGEQFELKSKEIEIYKSKLVNVYNGIYCIDFEVSSGTYIRSIVRDMAKTMNVYGYMAGLIRTSLSDFDIKDSVTFDELENNIDEVIKPENALSFLKSIKISNEDYRKLIDGVHSKITMDNGFYNIYTSEFKGILKSEDNIQKLYLWIKREDK